MPPRGREKSSAVQYYYQALGVAPPEERRDLRRRLAELLLELSSTEPKYCSQAEEEARELLKLDQNDAQGWRFLATALYGQSFRSGIKTNNISDSKTAKLVRQSRTSASVKRGGNDAKEQGGKEEDEKATLGEVLQRAHKLNPGDIEIAAKLADAYRNNPQLLDDQQQALPDAQRKALADQVFEEMVAADSKSAKAHLARYRYRLACKLPNAEDDLAAALKFGPDDLDVLLRAGSDAPSPRSGSPADADAAWMQAVKHFQHATEVAPADVRAYLLLANLYVAQGKPDDAAKWLRSGVEKLSKESINYFAAIALNASLADLFVDQGKLDDAEKILRDLAQTIEKIGPQLNDPRLVAEKLSLQRTNDLLRGKWLVRKGQYQRAIPLLRLVAVGQPSTQSEILRLVVVGQPSRQSLDAWRWLGVAYGAIGQWDQSAAAYEQAADLAPTSGRLRAQAAGAWNMAGRPDRAAAFYKQALDIEAAPETWLALAQVEFQRLMRLPKEERKWDSFDKALAEAKKPDDKRPLANPWQLKLLEANYTLVRGEEQGDTDQAVRDALALVRTAAEDNPDAAGLWQALVPFYERLEQPADADRALEHLGKLKDQAGVACLSRAELDAGRKQYDQAKKTLAAGLETLPAEMRPALRRELVQIAIREGQIDQAREQLRTLHDMEPDNLALVTQLADLALQTGTYAEAEQWEKELRKLEGPEGLFSQYYEALRLVAEASGAEDTKAADAKRTRASELQANVQKLRPAWPKAYVLQARLSESRGKFVEAAAAYREAIRLGEQQSATYERLVSLLMQLDRPAEADHYLRLMQDQIAGSETLSSLEIRVAAQRGQPDRAVEAARRAVERRPQDPIAHLWLGQVLLAGGKTAEAETSLKRAVELAPTDVRTLGGLFGFYARSKQSDRARETLQEVAKNEKLTESERASILAQGYELLGDQEQAKINYRQAAKLAPDDGAAQVRLATYLLRTGTDTSEPEQLLRGVLQRKPDSGDARRMLAALLLERGGEEQWKEARRLVEQAAADRTNPDADRRMDALLLARRGGKENVDQATRIFEELVVDPNKVEASDRLRLAQLYEIDGKVEPARQQYLKLLSRVNPTAPQVAAYVEWLLRHDRCDEADPWLKRLESLAPDDLGVAALRARWLHGTAKDGQIEPLVEALAAKLLKQPADDKLQEAALVLRVGNLYSAVGQQQEAERWYRRLVEVAPERYEPLANALAQQGRTREAIELCQKAAQSDNSARPAMTLAGVLVAGKSTADDFQLAEATLAKAVTDHKDDANLLSAVANVRVIQQRIDDAAGLYRQVLTLKPMNVAALNNLATILAEAKQPAQRQEALKHIERAIQIVGPQPGLLDTKGMILVFEGKPEEAVPLLQEATTGAGSDPRFYFHLAVAYDQAGEAEKARAALSTARKGDLTRQVLTPKDQKLLADLEKKFSP